MVGMQLNHEWASYGSAKCNGDVLSANNNTKHFTLGGFN